MRDILAFFSGRVDAQAQGNQIEQFINQAHRRGIQLRAPRRTEDGRLLFTVPRRSFKKLRGPAFKTGTRVRILKKRGLFMAIRPFKKRVGLAVGLALFLGLVFYSSRFVWQVEVSGCVNISATEVVEDLKDYGFGVGCSRWIDVGPIENSYLTGNEKISWMSINIRGTTAYIEVKEKGLHPKVEDLSMPTNIYAARDGVIVSVRDYGGNRQVEIGDTVTAGDLLVSGDWTDKYGVRRLSHCIATVIAETRRETEITVPLQEEVRQKTGKTKNFYAISFGKLKIPLYFSKKISYNDYDTITNDRPLRIASFAFPIRLTHTRVDEVALSAVTRTPEEARKEAFAQLGFYETDRLSDVTVKSRETQELSADDRFTLRAVFQCEEEIGIEMPIEE